MATHTPANRTCVEGLEHIRSWLRDGRYLFVDKDNILHSLRLLAGDVDHPRRRCKCVSCRARRILEEYDGRS